MDGHGGWVGGEGGAVDGHGDGGVVVFEAHEFVAPEFSVWARSVQHVIYAGPFEVGAWWVGVCVYLGPMCPPSIFCANRMWMRLTSLGSTRAPEPRRMARSLVCNLRMRCGRETMVAVLAVCYRGSIVGPVEQMACEGWKVGHDSGMGLGGFAEDQSFTSATCIRDGTGSSISDTRQKDTHRADARKPADNHWLPAMASLFRHRPRPQTALCPYHRAFSTTVPRAVSLQLEKNDSEAVADTVPAYPHGPARWYKQSRLGLYGGQRIRFGNNVGEKIEVKTRRDWKPNILTRKLFSRSLDRHVQVRVSTRVLRTIDKLGGLDEYLLGEKEGRIRELGESGWWLRWAIMQTPAIKAKFAEERRRLGVPESVVVEQEEAAAAAQTVIEEVSDAEAEAAAEEGEAVATDDAFQIEAAPDLPTLKFRVGPNKHLILTPTGWRRTRPTTKHAIETAIDKLRRRILDDMLPRKEAEFRANLSEQQAKLGLSDRLRTAEIEQMVKEARREWRRDGVAEAQRRYAAHVAKREERKAERRERRRNERGGGRGEVGVEVAE